MTDKEREQPQTEDNILIQVYDAEDAPTHTATASAEPTHEYQTHNATRDSYHETIVEALSGTTPELTADVLVLGDSTTDTAQIPKGQPLGNELLRVSITDTTTDGQTFLASTFLDSSQGNAITFKEAGLVAEQSGGGDVPLNRFLISDPGGLLDPKSSEETVTIDINIRQEDA
jgi:hypothetical protein